MDNKKHLRVIWLASGVVFLCWISVFLFLKATYPDRFTVQDDPYFHARYAAFLSEGVTNPPLPYASTLSMYGGGSVYVLYHHALATFFKITKATGSDELLIQASKQFHALLAAVVVALLFFIIVKLVYVADKYHSIRFALSVGLASTFALTFLFPMFIFRLNTERPLLLSILLFTGITYAIITRKQILQFLLGVLFPLCYSFSVLALLPPIAYGLTQWFVYKNRSLQQVGKPFLVVLSGLLIGVLLHPTSLHYLVNAYWVHVLMLVNSAGGGEIEATELSRWAFNPIDIPWLVLTGALLSYLSIKRKDFLHEERSSPLVFLSVLTCLLAPLFVMYIRTIELFAPITFITLSVGGAYVYREYQSMFLPQIQKNYGKVVLAGTACTLLILCGNLVYVQVGRNSSATERIQAQMHLFEDLSTQSNAGDRVLLSSVHLFPMGYFYAPKNFFANSISTDFMYVWNQSAHNALRRLLDDPTSICTKKICTDDDFDPYVVLTEVFDASYFILDTDPIFSNQVVNHEVLRTLLLRDDRFEVLSDITIANGHQYTVYKIMPLLSNNPQDRD